MMRTLLTGLAVVLLAGCGGDGNDCSTEHPCVEVVPDPSPRLLCTIDPGGPRCATPTPTHTPDNTLHKSCPVTPGETVIIDGTPYVVFAKACTRTPTPLGAPLGQP